MVTLRQDAVQLYMNSRYAPTPGVKAAILVNFTTCSSPPQIERYTSHHQNFVSVSLSISSFTILYILHFYMRNFAIMNIFVGSFGLNAKEGMQS